MYPGFLVRWIRQRYSKFGKSSWYGVNRGPDTKNWILPPGVSSHARILLFTRLFLYFIASRLITIGHCISATTLLSEMLEMPSTTTAGTSFPQKKKIPMVVPLSISRKEKILVVPFEEIRTVYVTVYGIFRGWWFTPRCEPLVAANLNGVWHADCASNPPNSGIQWNTWKGSNYSLYEVSMKVRPGIWSKTTWA